MQAAGLKKDCNSFTVCVAIGMFVLGVWGITLHLFFPSGTGLLGGGRGVQVGKAPWLKRNITIFYTL